MKGSLTNLNDSFSHFIGTENYYSHLMRTCVFTDGVKAMADQYQAYWLIDVIASYQMTKRIKCIPFQIWSINSTEGKVVIEMCEDTDKPVLVRQQIPYTDFPEGSLQLYCIDDSEHKIILLPSEY